MPNDISLVSRRTGRMLAGAGALLLLAWCALTARAESIPQFHVYDAWWMLLGGAAGWSVAALIGWRWQRERGLALVLAATILGSWVPIAILGLRVHVPVWARIKGAWVLAGGDVVALALPVAAALAWLALRNVTAPD